MRLFPRLSRSREATFPLDTSVNGVTTRLTVGANVTLLRYSHHTEIVGGGLGDGRGWFPNCAAASVVGSWREARQYMSDSPNATSPS